MYEVGKVYIWQNCKYKPHMNGQECTVTSVPRMVWDGRETFLAQKTDSPSSENTSGFWFARAGQLRPKNPPTGESKTMELFQPKPVLEPA